PWMMSFAKTIHVAKKYVVSDSLKQVDWNAELVRRDALLDTVRRLKQEPGRGLYTGGVTMPLALADAGLIDDYEFIVQPRLAGHGPRPFEGLSQHVELELVGRREFSGGSVALRYAAKR